MALQNSKLVMIWRAVSELPKTSAKIAQATGWPKIGENSYAAMFDAGNLMVGYWVQQGLFDTLTKPSTTSLTLKPRGASACGQASFSRMMLVSNPASEFVIRSAFPVNFITTAAGVGGPYTSEDVGERVTPEPAEQRGARVGSNFGGEP